MGWVFVVGKRWQITIRKLAPVLDIKPGDEVECVVDNGKIKIKKVNGKITVEKRDES